MPDTRGIALAWSLGRVVIGAALTVAPETFTRGWLGADASRPGARLVSTSLGARDVALGVGAAAALRSGDSARAWLLGCAIADAADLAATLRAREHIPRAGLIGVGALAGGSAALGAWLSAAID